MCLSECVVCDNHEFSEDDSDEMARIVNVEAYRWNLQCVNPHRRQKRLFQAPGIFRSARENSIFGLRQQITEAGGVNVTDHDGQTIIMVAAKYGATRFIKKVFYHHLARVNAQDVYGRTALMYAIRRGSRRCVEVLLHQGTDVDITDNWNATALHYAAFCPNPIVLRMILAKRPDINAKDYFHSTPLDTAVVRGMARNVKILLQNGADRKLKDYKGRIPLIAAVQHQEPALVQNLMTMDTVDIPDHEGKTALYYSVLQGKTNIVEMLIVQGASLLTRDNFPVN